MENDDFLRPRRKENRGWKPEGGKDDFLLSFASRRSYKENGDIIKEKRDRSFDRRSIVTRIKFLSPLVVETRSFVVQRNSSRKEKRRDEKEKENG